MDCCNKEQRVGFVTIGSWTIANNIDNATEVAEAFFWMLIKGFSAKFISFVSWNKRLKANFKTH